MWRRLRNLWRISAVDAPAQSEHPADALMNPFFSYEPVKGGPKMAQIIKAKKDDPIQDIIDEQNDDQTI